MKLPLELRHYLRQIVWSSDNIYRPIGHLRGRGAFGPEECSYFVSGYPRSGNHFCSYALRLLSKDDYRINKPSHIPPLVERSVRMNHPTIVVLRNPRKAALSWSIYTGEPLVASLKYYVQYHELIWKHRSGFLVAEFEDFTKDIRPLAKALFERWSLEFDLSSYDHKGLTNQTFAAIEKKERLHRGGNLNDDQLPTPTATRKAKKDSLTDEFNRTRHATLLKDCITWHQKFHALKV